jgi:hypothetical protein
MASEDQYTSPVQDTDIEPEATFHDTIQRGLLSAISNPGSVTSVTSKIQPTTLLPSNYPSYHQL